MTVAMKNWRTQTLPDGREVEFVSAVYGTDEPDDPPDMVPADVTVLIDGITLQTIRVLLPAQQVVEAIDNDSGDRWR